MGIFNSSKIIATELKDLSPVLSDVKEHFEKEGFEVETKETETGGIISITKGDLFKAVMGLKSALNTTLTVQEGSVLVEAKIGAFGGKVIAAAGAVLATGILGVTAGVGLYNQSQLDEEMIAEIEKSIYKHASTNIGSASPVRQGKFCTHCGAAVQEDALFCQKCGNKL